jgi:hypothetical protein
MNNRQRFNATMHYQPVEPGAARWAAKFHRLVHLCSNAPPYQTKLKWGINSKVKKLKTHHLPPFLPFTTLDFSPIHP